MIPSNSSSVKSSSISLRIVWRKLAKKMAKRTRKMGLNLLRSPEMCRPWWTPARLHQIACNQKYCAATKPRSSGDVDVLSHVKREKNTKGVYFYQYLSDCEQLYCLWVKISKSGPKYCLSIGFHKNCDPTQMSMFPLNCIILSFHQQCGAKLYWVDQEQICFLSKMMGESPSSECRFPRHCIECSGRQAVEIGQLQFSNWTNTLCKLDKYILQVVQIHVLAVTDSKFPGRWMWRQAAPCKASGNLLYSAPHPSS